MSEGGMNMWKPCKKALICGWMALVIRSSVTSWTYSAYKKEVFVIISFLISRIKMVATTSVSQLRGNGSELSILAPTVTQHSLSHSSPSVPLGMLHRPRVGGYHASAVKTLGQIPSQRSGVSYITSQLHQGNTRCLARFPWCFTPLSERILTLQIHNSEHPVQPKTLQ